MDSDGTVGVAVDQLQSIATGLEQMGLFRQIFRKRSLFAICTEREKAASGKYDRDIHVPAEFSCRSRVHGTSDGIAVAHQHERGGFPGQITDFGAGIADEFHLRFHIFVARERKLRIKQRQFSHRTAINLNPRSGQFHR